MRKLFLALMMFVIVSGTVYACEDENSVHAITISPTEWVIINGPIWSNPLIQFVSNGWLVWEEYPGDWHTYLTAIGSGYMLVLVDGMYNTIVIIDADGGIRGQRTLANGIASTFEVSRTDYPSYTP